MALTLRKKSSARHSALALATLAGGLVLAHPATAQQTNREWRGTLDGLTVDLSTGLLNGHGREYVLNPDGSSVSMLRWNMRNVLMFNAAIAYRPADWLKLEMRGSTNFTGMSHMDDYDWNIPGCPASPTGTYCESNHPDTVLRNAILFDSFAAARFLTLGPVQLSAVAGYKFDFYRWQGSGGTSNYAPFPPGSGISYDQTWRAPYLGLAMEAEHGPWSLRGRLIGSVWALGTGRDLHHLRSTLFTDRLGPGQMMAAEIGLGYQIRPGMTLTADYRYQAWRIAQGPADSQALGGALTSFPGKGGGGSNTSHMVSLGLRIRPGEAVRMAQGAPTAPVSLAGFHAGVDIGAAWQNAGWTTNSMGGTPGRLVPETAAARLGSGAPRVGFFAGYGRQVGAWIVGAEADIGLANANRTIVGVPGALDATAIVSATDGVRMTRLWDASLRARFGYEVKPGLALYATGGLAMAASQLRVGCNNGASCVGGTSLDQSVTSTRLGWTLGAGAEAALAGPWFARAEYRYSAYAAVNPTFFATVPADTIRSTVSLNDHRASVALGYRY
ncbi:omptin family outer membrane protease [Phreatobacter aquaticus]|nr:omptin family outer membrane protease [Phreatobacter aquaticus]